MTATAVAGQVSLDAERRRIAAALDAVHGRITALPDAKRRAQDANDFRAFSDLERQEPVLRAERDRLVSKLAALDQQLAAEQTRAARAAQEHELARRADALRRTYLETQSHLAELARLTDAALTLSAQHDALYAEVRGMPPGSGWQVGAGERERLGHALRLLGQWIGTGLRPVRVSTAPGTALDDVQHLLFDQQLRRTA